MRFCFGKPDRDNNGAILRVPKAADVHTGKRIIPSWGAYMLDTKQLPDFATWGRNQQATQLASYRKKEN